jgi:hypothetical protein
LYPSGVHGHTSGRSRRSEGISLRHMLSNRGNAGARCAAPPFGNPAASGHGGLVALRPRPQAGCLFVDGEYCIRSSRIVPSGCTAIDPTPLLFNNSHLEILDVLRCYQSLTTDTLAIRHISSNPSRNLARTRPRYSAMSSIADAQEQRSRGLPAVASAE